MGSEVILFKVLACVIIVVVNCLGVFLPLLYTKQVTSNAGIKKYNCLLAGVLFTSAVCQMLPEASKAAEETFGEYTFAVVHFVFGIGFCVTVGVQFMLEGAKRRRHTKQAFENMMRSTKNEFGRYNSFSEAEEEIGEEIKLSEPYEEETMEDLSSYDQPNVIVLVAIFSIENILTGVTLGSQNTPSMILVLAVSISATDWIEAVLFCMSLAVAYGTRSDFRKFAFKYAAIYSVIAAVTTVSWVVIISLIPQNESVTLASAFTMAFLGGSVLYIACKDILAKEIDDTEIEGAYPNLSKVFGKTGQFVAGFFIVNMVLVGEAVAS